MAKRDRIVITEMIEFGDKSVFEIGEFRLCVEPNLDVVGMWSWSICCCGEHLKSGHRESKELAEKACRSAFGKLCKPLLAAAEPLSHAPVIDAEKLAEKIQSEGFTKYERSSPNPEKRELIQLISDGIDLRLDWVDGKAEWGIFRLRVQYNIEDSWWAALDLGSAQSSRWSETDIESQELAQQACEKALKRIITGVRE